MLCSWSYFPRAGIFVAYASCPGHAGKDPAKHCSKDDLKLQTLKYKIEEEHELEFPVISSPSTAIIAPLLSVGLNLRLGGKLNLNLCIN